MSSNYWWICQTSTEEAAMTDTDRLRLERRASLLKSLAHPSRLLILEMLENTPCCVGELTKAIGADITTVSKHLSVLKRVGLVKDVKHGTYSEYSLVCDCANYFIDCIEDGMTGHVCDKRTASERTFKQ
jgi:ArsR family transcriptional regulator